MTAHPGSGQNTRRYGENIENENPEAMKQVIVSFKKPLQS